MCKAGGPRCEDKRKNRVPDNAAILAAPGAPKPPATVAVKERPARGGKAFVPDRDDTDRLAADLPATRTDGFGQPLDDRGRRLFALRESGYTGPIDQDGYPDTTSEGAETLRYMARQRGETVDW